MEYGISIISKVMFIVVPILALAGIIFTFAMMFSAKLRGKMMSQNVKATKHMLDNSQLDIEDMMVKTSGMAVSAKERILDANAEAMRDISTREAEIRSAGVETTARAVKRGFAEDRMYCKFCGVSIDSDSRFCKHCGNEQQ